MCLACSGGSRPASEPPPPPPTPTPASSCLDATYHSQCPANQLCSSLISNRTVTPTCLPGCSFGSNQSDCGPGHLCYPMLGAPDRGSCRPACTQDGDCRNGLSCDFPSGQCRCKAASDCATAFGFPAACRADGFCATNCTLDADCGCGALCVNGSCQAGCNSNSDCCGGGTCAAGRCTPPAAAAAYARCASSDDCAAGLICDGQFSRGECIPYPDLSRNCATGACPSGSTCISYPAADNKLLLYCLERCTPGSNAGCNQGSLCLHVPNDPGNAACFPACADDSQCGTGMTCNKTTHECACQSDSACAFWGPGATCSPMTGECSAPKCVPRCDGTTCGSDGCGGTCACASGFQCNSSNQCVRPSSGCTRNADCSSNCCNTSTGACVASSNCQAPPSSCQSPGTGTCQDASSVYCGIGCCPASAPFACSSTRSCYPSQAQAEAACGGSACYQCVAGNSGQYQPGGQYNGCVHSFYDPNFYNWLAWENDCSVPVNVVYACAQPGCSGAMVLDPGKHDSTGYSQSEINGYGGILAAICGSDYNPVNSNDQYWSYNESYRCKHK